MRAPSKRGDSFGPDWLRGRLAHLLPDFPDVALCVALSGGVDSTVLLAAIAQMRADGGREGTREARLRALHVNHGLHPNAKRWSAHCRKLARQLGVPLKVLEVSVARERGASLEEAARVARYRCFAQQLRGGEALLTAHTQDDQLETVLLQLFRGCGLPGIAAMPGVAPLGSGKLARPLLGCSRSELEAWARARDLAWIEDDTNADERFDRNYLRRSVLPAVRQRWPGVGAAVARSARHAAEAQRLLTALALADLERASDGGSLSVKALRLLPPDRRRNVLRLWIASGGHTLPDARRLQEISGPLIDARADAHPRVEWGSERTAQSGSAPRIIVMRHADRLSIAVRDPMLGSAVPAEPLGWDWRESSRCVLPDGGALELTPERHGPVDLDALPPRLAVTWRRGGEKLRVRRGGPRRALKSLLQEAHVPLADRARLPLLMAEGAVIAAADLWIDESVRASPEARHRGRLIWRKRN
ncbi:MAG TPA: tRNA lysidine(34) synthetase TilS [Steroidobacteraceae bacterium]|jgi:tRNA(Ile)-lysidine synthase|nr:tRNA lysidine(34) synthetase TilS [Steroidobacteraceae bacterium]